MFRCKSLGIRDKAIELVRRNVSGDIYKNILLLPPGYPVWGRREVNNQESGGGCFR